jgi:soluble lytic murein transglycosylase
LVLRACVVLAGLVGGATLLHGQQSSVSRLGLDSLLVATAHPPLPAEPSLYWFVPERARSARGVDAASRRLAQGAQFIAARDFGAGLPLISAPDLADPYLVNYASYYRGVAQIGLGRYDEAMATLSLLASRRLEGALKELATLQLAEAALARGLPDRVEPALAQLTTEKLANAEDVWLMRARVEEAAGHRAHALESYRKLYYDYPLSAQAAAAPPAIGRLRTGDLDQVEPFERSLARAERFYSAKRWADAKSAFTALSPRDADGRELVALRLAEADYYMGARRQAREALKPLLASPARGAEARYISLLATKALGDRSGYRKQVRDLVDDYPDSPWSEEALNGLGSDLITSDDDDEADAVFRELLRKFPEGRYAERAGWKVGWRSYRAGEFEAAADIFDAAAVRAPRADNRPAWLYRSGRAHDRLSDPVTANTRYRLVVADYQNSYYGRLASKILASRGVPATTARITAAPSATISATVASDDIIRALITAQMYGDALREVQYAQRVWGDSPQLQATSAWIRHQQGLTLSAEERFAALRGAITTMRRAYPQFMAAGGEAMPADVLRIIFPLDYWPLITKYSTMHGLDPYLVAALMAQESTFTAEIRSHANAYGLMQIIPDTGRRYARKLGIKPFTTAMLRQPEINVRIGTQFFRDLIDRYGGAHFALASYNAGESRVDRWSNERPGIAQDEFIDDIPFPETQTYVKRILGTAEDYRYLYGGGLLDPNLGTVAAAARTAPPVAAAAPAKPAVAKKATPVRKAAPAKKPARRPARRPRR